ncbi:outer membrane protein assembly factor BamC [Shewanella sairae]|uniref:Outer membrane protein assembly factor BamC n=1 Tax=Shewanella sairae TaxID=190310 RepID=A0ABQ4PQ32_9GAMM|nr:outer membrane protein assembly factor BamC [Shewanella sairae]MCL1130064.1 outer membrane protein assembly factor BamC [Shewanella sairae]GIU50904.1 outer membrane protein assembly factor BamC [Shewanella sairae]
MLKQISPLILVAAVTACSTPVDRRQANDTDQNYQDLAVAPQLVIPSGLKQPTYSKEFDIPEVGAKVDTTLVGNRLDIRPPLQVLPMAEGTRVEEGSDNIKIVVESIDNEIDLKQEIFDVLKEYFASKSISLISENFEKGTLETDWISSEQVIESSLWGSDKVYQLKQRYLYTVDVRPHGRSGNLTIDLVEHEESYDGDLQDILLSGEDKRRYTIDRLNDSVSYISIERAKALKAKRLKQSLGIDVNLIAEAEEQAYWLADAKFKRTWDRLRIVLPEMGFEIVDMDSNKGLLYINITDDSGFWSSLWSDKELPIEAGSYRLELKDGVDDKTEIHLLNAENAPLSNEVVTAVYEGFAELMQEDRKTR